MALIVDSGGLLAAMDPNQNRHEKFRDALQSAHEPRLISPFVAAELDYMIFRNYGREDQLAFLGEVDRGSYRLELFDKEDFSRANALVARYEYLPGFGISDASNVVLAERYGAFDIPPPISATSARSPIPEAAVSASCPTIHDSLAFHTQNTGRVFSMTGHLPERPFPDYPTRAHAPHHPGGVENDMTEFARGR